VINRDEILTLDPESLAQEEIEDREARAIIYMDDLKEVLSTSAGVRVLRHWINETQLSNKFCDSPEIYRRAALADYGNSRMLEICAAEPSAAIRLMVVGLKDELREERKNLDSEE